MALREAHQNRERIPERVVHAKGWSAHGTLTVTHDITKYTRAKVFSQVGKQTPMIARFSTVAGEMGAADAARHDHRAGNDDYSQAARFRLIGPAVQARLMDNIAEAMAGVPVEIQRRQIAHFTRADPAYGTGVATRLALSLPDAPNVAAE